MNDIRRVIALGFFDGVHLGHAALLNKTLERAKELVATASVLSFDIPPVKTIGGAPVPMINSPLDRADIIKRLYGIDDLIFLHFDDRLRHMPWQDFIDWLISDFGAVHLIAGYDFRFGFKGQGNANLLRARCAELNIGCDIVDQVSDHGAAISSTRIRELLIDGKCSEANALLGHRHILTDVVRHGYRLGRAIGIPTINMRFDDGVLIPRHGVYITKAHLLDSGEVYIAVTNIGVRPTVSGDDTVSVESYLLDFSGNLYGKKVRLEFYKFLRPEMKFDGLEQLKFQIRSDAMKTYEYFENYKNK